eukprot:366259-Chlamydomonas_euryale.AAC.24
MPRAGARCLMTSRRSWALRRHPRRPPHKLEAPHPPHPPHQGCCTYFLSIGWLHAALHALGSAHGATHVRRVTPAGLPKPIAVKDCHKGSVPGPKVQVLLRAVFAARNRTEVWMAEVDGVRADKDRVCDGLGQGLVY